MRCSVNNCSETACASVSIKANPNIDEYRWVRKGDIVVVYYCRHHLFQKGDSSCLIF